MGYKFTFFLLHQTKVKTGTLQQHCFQHHLAFIDITLILINSTEHVQTNCSSICYVDLSINCHVALLIELWAVVSVTQVHTSDILDTSLVATYICSSFDIFFSSCNLNYLPPRL